MGKDRASCVLPFLLWVHFRSDGFMYAHGGLFRDPERAFLAQWWHTAYRCDYTVKRDTEYIVHMGNTDTQDFERLGTLARKAQEGDGASYEELLEQLYAYVHRVLWARLGHVSELDDLTQICVLAMHNALPTYHPSRSLKPWVNAIIRYKIADYFRAQARSRESPQPEEILEVANQWSNAHEDEGGDSNVPLNILELLSRLPKPLATAVQLTKIDGLSCEDAARREGIKSGALRKRVSRAYRELARMIEKEAESDYHGR